MRTFVANRHPREGGEHSNGPGKPGNKGLLNNPQRSRDATKDTFDYKKYLKFLNDQRYHKVRKQRERWGEIVLIQVADKR